MDTTLARTRLEEMLADLERSASTLQGEDAGDDPGELTSLDQHPADSATNLDDASRQEAVIAAVLAQRDEVQEALTRLDEGTYGKCIDCGTQLPDARLEARPEAARCVDCQAKVEAQR